MDTPYENLDNDTRQDWLEYPATQAFLATVRTLHDQRREGIVLNAMNGGVDESAYRFDGGAMTAYRMILDLAARVKRDR